MIKYVFSSEEEALKSLQRVTEEVRQREKEADILSVQKALLHQRRDFAQFCAELLAANISARLEALQDKLVNYYDLKREYKEAGAVVVRRMNHVQALKKEWHKLKSEIDNLVNEQRAREAMSVYTDVIKSME